MVIKVFGGLQKVAHKNWDPVEEGMSTSILKHPSTPKGGDHLLRILDRADMSIKSTRLDIVNYLADNLVRFRNCHVLATW